VAGRKQVVRWWSKVRHVSKSLPMSVLAIGLLGCEPITASVVELSTRDASVSIPPGKDARVAPDGEADDKDGTAVEPGHPEPDGCLVLVDQTIAEVVTDAAVVASRFVQSRTATAAGCIDADAGPQYLNASVFSRRDGQPMVERGQSYSYRWKSDTAMNRVRLQGGDEACANETVVSFDHGAFQSAPLGIASCYEFEAPIEARYLRTTAADYLSPLAWLNLGAKPTELRLCPGRCPPGTEHDFTVDAGIPDAAAP
jgi:hypothetical protein